MKVHKVKKVKSLGINPLMTEFEFLFVVMIQWIGHWASKTRGKEED